MSLSYEFDCDVDTLLGLLNDPQYLVDRNLELGELEADCEVEAQGDTTVVTMRRKVHRELPGFLKKIFDPDQVMHMVEKWNDDGEGGWAGSFVMDFEGKPISISADFELYATDTGCCYNIEHRAKAKVPLIRSKLEKYVLGETTSTCDNEMDHLRTRVESL